MKKPFLLLLFLQISFSASNLAVNSVEYTSLYSNSESYITFNLENIGDEAAVLINNNLTGLDNYLVYFSPSIINPGEEAQVIFKASLGCEPLGSSHDFSANFSYQDSTQSNYVSSGSYEIITASPLTITLTIPNDLDSMLAIRTTEVGKILYSVSNSGLKDLFFNMSVSSDDSIFSKIKTSQKEYSTSSVGSESFSLQPQESYIFSHSLVPIISGFSGTYTIIITDETCSYNREIMTANYQIVSSTSGFGNIIVADENNPLIILIGLVVLILLFDTFLTSKRTF